MTHVHSWGMLLGLVMVGFVVRVEAFVPFHHPRNKYLDIAAGNSAAVMRATQVAESSFAELEPFIIDKQVTRKAVAFMVKKATEKFETQVSLLQGRLEDKNAIVDEKDARLGEIQVKYVKLDAEHSVLKAKYHAETNLRPMLEMELQRWYVKRHDIPEYTLPKSYRTSTALNEFVGLLDSDKPQDQDDKHKLAKAITDVCNTMGLSSKANQELVIQKLQHLYIVMSAEIHDTNAPKLPEGLTGFVLVNKDKFFSSAMSAFFVFFSISHTVMSDDYKGIRYKFNPVE